MRALSERYPLQKLKKMSFEEIALEYYRTCGQGSVTEAMEKTYLQAFNVLNSLLNNVQIARFEFGSSKMAAEMRKVAEEQIRELQKFPILLSDATVLTEAVLFGADFFVTSDYRTIIKVYDMLLQVITEFLEQVNPGISYPLKAPPKILRPEKVFKWDSARNILEQ